MANALTGDFDLVAQFSMGGANRILAAMHSSGRFLHSMSIRVDDTTVLGPKLPHFTAVEAVDMFGEPVVNHSQIGNPQPIPGVSISTDPVRAGLGGVVNPDLAGALEGGIVPSNIKGVAQLQVFPPTCAVPDASGSKIALRINFMSRFFPDPNTAPLAEFMRGDLQVIADVTQAASQTANVIDIDFKANTAFITFTPSFTSNSLSPEDLAGINLCIRNALKTSTLPASASLPANVSFMQFRTLLSPQNAIAVLLNLGSPRGNAASLTDIFLTGEDDFALAVSVDFIRRALQPTINAILNQPPFSITIPIDVYFSTYHVVYSIALKGVTVDLQNGGLVLTVTGDATETSHKWYAPDNFSFTAKMNFSITTDGTTLNLVPGDVSLDTSSWLVNQFRGSAKSGITQARDQALNQSGALAAVRSMFDVNKNLGDFLNGLLTPARTIAVLRSQSLQLAYTSAAVQPEGIVLHGSVSVFASQRVAVAEMGANLAAPVPSWPRPRVEFERVPAAPGQVHAGSAILEGPDYSALKSWIPGGTIQTYEWSTASEPQPFATDGNKFVLESSGPINVAAAAIAPYSPLCLTIRGSRISASGPAVPQPVSASVCGYKSVPVIPGGLDVSVNEALPLIALTHADPNGRIQIAGHVAAQSGAQRGTPNLLIHFPDARSIENLRLVNQALLDAGRRDAATAIVVVLERDQFVNASFAQNIIFADNSNGAWNKVFKAEQGRPLTMLVTPEGKALWRDSGELSRETLAEALKKMLVKCGFGWMNMFRPAARIGLPAPDFLFDYAPGRQLTLRKLAPKNATLVFWRGVSPASIEEVVDLQRANSGDVVLLAINDGDAADDARRIAAKHGFQRNLVVDPSREISNAYGIEVWPTSVMVNGSGFIAGANIGRAHTNRETGAAQARAAS